MRNRIITGVNTIVFAALLVLAGCHDDNKIQPTCFDEEKNQGEVKVDCGGPNCPACPPTCDDRVLNQDEEQIDCGGENCEPCATCSDGIQNAHWIEVPGSYTDENIEYIQSLEGVLEYVEDDSSGLRYIYVMEVGIDCGYPCSTGCVPTCDDGIQNGDERGIDCGGDCPDQCPPPTCNDGIQNGNETGVDCGSDACPPCDPNSCDDGIMNNHIEYVDESVDPDGYIVVVEQGIDCDNNPLTSCPDCPVPTCFDGVMNGSETGIDCGGSCGTTCETGVTCNNGIQDGSEAGIDCDLDDTTPCPQCPTCDDGFQNGPEYAVDCLDYPMGDAYPCDSICVSCHDGELNQFEVLTDCGGFNCDPCDMEFFADSLSGGFPFITDSTGIQVNNQGQNLQIVGTQTVSEGYSRVITVTIPTNVPYGIEDEDIEMDWGSAPQPGNVGGVPPIQPTATMRVDIYGTTEYQTNMPITSSESDLVMDQFVNSPVPNDDRIHFSVEEITVPGLPPAQNQSVTVYGLVIKINAQLQ